MSIEQQMYADNVELRSLLQFEQGKVLYADQLIDNYRVALRNLVRECPTSLTCDNVSHSKKHDQHGAEENCPPLCRYYKALYEAQEMLN